MSFSKLCSGNIANSARAASNRSVPAAVCRVPCHFSIGHNLLDPSRRINQPLELLRRNGEFPFPFGGMNLRTALNEKVLGVVAFIETNRNFPSGKLAISLAHSRGAIQNDEAIVAPNGEAAPGRAHRKAASSVRGRHIKLNRMLDLHRRILRTVRDSHAAAMAAGEIELYRRRSRSLARVPVEREVARLHFQCSLCRLARRWADSL